jgi:thiol-disulfide isomerase/thioredoxin
MIMSPLAGAVVLLAVLTFANLLLTFGLVHRMRQHALLLTRLAQAARAPAPVLPAGTAIGPFAVRTVEGEPFSRGGLDGPTLVGFFSPGCGDCRTAAADFLAVAADLEPGRLHLAAVVTSGPEAAALAVQLSGVARVVVEPEGGPVQAAFGVTGFPAFCLVDRQGRVLASGCDLRELPLLQAADDVGAPLKLATPSAGA